MVEGGINWSLLGPEYREKEKIRVEAGEEDTGR